MPDPEFSNLGLFPLGVVLLPGERMPLHIFEPRYRELIADCTLGARPFVLSLGTENGVARTGCTATPVALLRRFDDGRMNLIVEGGDPVEILEQTTGSELYVTARVHVLADVDEPGDEGRHDQHEREHESTHAVLHTLNGERPAAPVLSK